MFFHTLWPKNANPVCFKKNGLDELSTYKNIVSLHFLGMDQNRRLPQQILPRFRSYEVNPINEIRG